MVFLNPGLNFGLVPPSSPRNSQFHPRQEIDQHFYQPKPGVFSPTPATRIVFPQRQRQQSHQQDHIQFPTKHQESHQVTDFNPSYKLQVSRMLKCCWWFDWYGYGCSMSLIFNITTEQFPAVSTHLSSIRWQQFIVAGNIAFERNNPWRELIRSVAVNKLNSTRCCCFIKAPSKHGLSGTIKTWLVCHHLHWKHASISKLHCHKCKSKSEVQGHNCKDFDDKIEWI